jgi:hypothetical protein
MASTANIMTSSITALGVGAASQFTAKQTQGQFTDWLVAGGLGVLGFLGATTQTGTLEWVGVGAINGASSYVGKELIDLLNVGGNQNNTTARRISQPRPKVVSMPQKSTQTQNNAKSVVQI